MATISSNLEVCNQYSKKHWQDKTLVNLAIYIYYLEEKSLANGLQIKYRHYREKTW